MNSRSKGPKSDPPPSPSPVPPSPRGGYPQGGFGDPPPGGVEKGRFGDPPGGGSKRGPRGGGQNPPFWGLTRDHGEGGEGRQTSSKWGGGISRNRSILRRCPIWTPSRGPPGRRFGGQNGTPPLPRAPGQADPPREGFWGGYPLFGPFGHEFEEFPGIAPFGASQLFSSFLSFSLNFLILLNLCMLVFLYLPFSNY